MTKYVIHKKYKPYKNLYILLKLLQGLILHLYTQIFDYDDNIIISFPFSRNINQLGLV